jgi:hypothetical protein
MPPQLVVSRTRALPGCASKVYPVISDRRTGVPSPETPTHGKPRFSYLSSFYLHLLLPRHTFTLAYRYSRLEFLKILRSIRTVLGNLRNGRSTEKFIHHVRIPSL